MASSKMRVLVAMAGLAVGMSTAFAACEVESDWDIPPFDVAELSMCPVDLPRGVMPPGLSFSADVFRAWEAFEHTRRIPWTAPFVQSYCGSVRQAQGFSSCWPGC